MIWKFHARTIREEHAAEHAANELNHQFPRFEEAYRALQWLLARKCDTIRCKYRIVNNVKYHLYVQAPNPLAKTPWIAVVFTYDDDMVNIIDIMAGH